MRNIRQVLESPCHCHGALPQIWADCTQITVAATRGVQKQATAAPAQHGGIAPRLSMRTIRVCGRERRVRPVAHAPRARRVRETSGWCDGSAPCTGCGPRCGHQRQRMPCRERCEPAASPARANGSPAGWLALLLFVVVRACLPWSRSPRLIEPAGPTQVRETPNLSMWLQVALKAIIEPSRW